MSSDMNPTAPSRQRRPREVPPAPAPAEPIINYPDPTTVDDPATPPPNPNDAPVRLGILFPELVIANS